MTLREAKAASDAAQKEMLNAADACAMASRATCAPPAFADAAHEWYLQAVLKADKTVRALICAQYEAGLEICNSTRCPREHRCPYWGHPSSPYSPCGIPLPM